MPDNTDIEIGKNIADKLSKLNMTAYELSKLSKIQQSTLSRAMRGEMSLKIEHMQKISDHLECTISELADVDPERNIRALTGVKAIDDAIELFYKSIWKGRHSAQQAVGHIISPSYRFHNCDCPLGNREKMTFKAEMSENFNYFKSLNKDQGQIETTIHSATIVNHQPTIHLTVMRPISPEDAHEATAYKKNNTIKRHETIDTWVVDKPWRDIEKSGTFQLQKRFMKTLNVNYNQTKMTIVTQLN
tara:strand:- start:5459 stop:6193 length:735 start_codon:yes stop_codon:yes gene_type:complete